MKLLYPLLQGSLVKSNNYSGGSLGISRECLQESIRVHFKNVSDFLIMKHMPKDDLAHRLLFA